MRKFIMWVMCIILVGLVGCQTTKAQTVKKEGKTYTSVSSRGASASKDVATTYVWKDSKGVTYPIYLHKYTKGKNVGQWGAYVIKKTKEGADRKYYFPGNQEVAAEISKEMGL